MPLPPDARAAYYPSTVVHLSLRFDEALLAGAEVAAGMSTDDATNTPASIPGKSFRSASVVGGPSKGSSQTSFILNRVPKSCSVELPSVRQAGSFSMELDFTELPIDPRTLRSAGVEIHMGTVSPEEFARGMTQTPDHGQQRPSILTPVLNARLNPNSSTLVMIGVVDEWEISYEDKETMISIKGRDLRGVLLDSPLTMRAMALLNLNQPIDAIVRQLINMHPMLSNLDVIVAPPDQWPHKRIPATLPDDIMPRHRQRARARRPGTPAPAVTPAATAAAATAAAAAPPAGAAAGSGSDLTYWDAIVRLCTFVGAVPYFTARTLLIRPIRSYFEQVEAGFNADIRTPFNPDIPRVVGDMEPYSVRRLVYGRNVQKLSFKRTMGGLQKPKVVRCIGVDTSHTDRTQNHEIEGRWPPMPPSPSRTATQRTTATTRGTTAAPAVPADVQNAANNRVAPSGSQTQTDYVNIFVPGVQNAERLTVMARSLFEEIGRNEFTGTAETADLASLGGDNDDPDLLRIRPGDAIQFFTDISAVHTGQESIVSTATDHFRRPVGDMTDEIAARLGNRDLARAIMATSRGSVNRIQNFFRVSSVDIKWDSDKGLTVSFDFQNYFVLRNQLGEPVAETTTQGHGRHGRHGRARPSATPRTPGKHDPISLSEIAPVPTINTTERRQFGIRQTPATQTATNQHVRQLTPAEQRRLFSGSPNLLAPQITFNNGPIFRIP